MRRACNAAITISASPQAVRDVVSDVTRIGEWSGECRGCEWTVPGSVAAPGARFRGRNRRGGFRWTRLNEVVALEAPHDLQWRTIARFPYFDSTNWRLRLEAVEGGTTVTETFEIVTLSRAMERFLSFAMPAHNDRSADLAEDLSRLKSVVESAPDATSANGQTAL